MTQAGAKAAVGWPRTMALAGIGVLGVWAIYSLVFFVAGPYTLPRSGLSAAVNVLPLVALALGVQHLLGRVGSAHSLPVLAVLHLVLAASFTLLWYGAVILGLAVLRWFEMGESTIQGFSGPALPWQCFQGLALYAAVAGVSHALRRMPPSTPAVISAERYLMKVDDALIPIQTADIVSLQGAHDYVQLTTPQGTHLVRHGLSEFAAKLEPARFVRIHRSVMVNLDHVEKVEMAGAGKFRVLMRSGAVFASSRAGAQLLRAMVL